MAVAYSGTANLATLYVDGAATSLSWQDTILTSPDDLDTQSYGNIGRSVVELTGIGLPFSC